MAGEARAPVLHGMRLGAVHAEGAIAGGLGGEALEEAAELALFAGGQADLRYGRSSGPGHPLDAVLGANVLRPDVSLQAEDVGVFRGSEAGREWIECVDLLGRHHASAGRRIVLLRAHAIVG